MEGASSEDLQDLRYALHAFRADGESLRIKTKQGNAGWVVSRHDTAQQSKKEIGRSATGYWTR